MAEQGEISAKGDSGNCTDLDLQQSLNYSVGQLKSIFILTLSDSNWTQIGLHNNNIKWIYLLYN